jgi:hypothetical protein
VTTRSAGLLEPGCSREWYRLVLRVKRPNWLVVASFTGECNDSWRRNLWVKDSPEGRGFRLEFSVTLGMATEPPSRSSTSRTQSTCGCVRTAIWTSRPTRDSN